MKITSANVIILFLLAGCANIHSVSKDELTSSDNYDVKLFVKDGRIIQYNSSKYKIDSTVSEKMIKGIGLVIADKLGPRNYSISNSISYSSIDSIQISEYGTGSKGIGIGFGILGSIGLALAILIMIHGPFRMV